MDDRLMIMPSTGHQCRTCGSTTIVKNGHNRSGSQQYRCKACGAIGVLNPTHAYSPERQEDIVRAYQERPSMRGIHRIFGGSRNALAAWIKKTLQTVPSLRATRPRAKADDQWEGDAVWSFGRQRAWKRWLWTVWCRRTKPLMAVVIGDHSERTCRRRWHRIPPAYRRCASVSDFWQTDAAVFPTATPRCVGKDPGETAHRERWHTTLRQRVARDVRNPLSFSKTDRWHDRITTWLIITYNVSLCC